ncbi:IS1182 family transposase [uncultured Methanobrevibacter sp.]|jgi:transposase|uniref:IS1182 family transposase n=1 Tax=uncultured Methanobrevibacter sp. TaxID=253161 RepID=UPI002586E361|nr:IS1182 family transposase [uncultured Methanobrevibacter sp.]
MVLREDKIGQQLLVPLDLRDLIPKDHPCYFIQNVVDQMDFSKVDANYCYKAGKPAYSRKMLLRLVLMGAFDGGLSGREVAAKAATDVSYMYLAGMEKPDFRTINRFKVDHAELIDDAFKTTVLMAKELDLVKLKHIAIDGTKIKAKASINNLTNQEQIDLLKDILKKSIELDEEEDEILGDESGNSVPKELIDKKSFEEIYKKVTESTKGDRNEFKLRRSSKKLLDQAKKDKKSAKKVLQKVEKIDSELKKTTNDVISINDPESRWMLNKKSKWEFDYNLQIGVDEYKGIIVSSSLTQNPTDVFELIPQIEQIKETFGALAPNTQISADNGYSTNENIDYLVENHLDGYISTRKLSRKLKKINKKDKPFGKDKFIFDHEKNTYICPMGQILENQKSYKNNSRIAYWTNNCKTCPKHQECCGKRYNRIITDYGNPNKIKMLRKMETDWAQEIYKKRSKTAEWPFGNIKQNLKVTEFNTTGLKRTQTEAKLLAISHNLKRIYNETIQNELIHQNNKQNT